MLKFHTSQSQCCAVCFQVFFGPVKNTMENSATVSTRIPLCRPYLSEEEELATLEVLRSGWLMEGAKVAEFEGLVANCVGTKYAVAVNSGTSALTLALLATGIFAGDEVIMPSHSFVATANSARHLGAEPSFVDIGPDDYNIDSSKIEPAINSGSRAIMAVHQIGYPADMESILSVAKKHDLLVVEDAACSLGSTYHGRQTGSFGEVACFSFHPRKLITTGEGGMIITNSEKIAQEVRSLRNHGLTVSGDNGKLRCREAGYNYRMTDIQAAIGIVQFRKLEEIIRLRTLLADHYNEAISKLPALRTPKQSGDSVPNYQSFVVELVDESISREALLGFMVENGIQCVPGIQPIHLEPAYSEKHSDRDLPETLRAAERSFFLPLYPTLTHQEQELVISSLKKAFDKSIMTKETQ